jgi:hypothetical protein
VIEGTAAVGLLQAKRLFVQQMLPHGDVGEVWLPCTNETDFIVILRNGDRPGASTVEVVEIALVVQEPRPVNHREFLIDPGGAGASA